jgi:hypothetical protein
MVIKKVGVKQTGAKYGHIFTVLIGILLFTSNTTERKIFF